MNKYTFLDVIGLQVHKERPKVPETLKYTILTEKKSNISFVRLWFRTRGCQHTHLLGGCTMCDYWVSDPVSPDAMVASVKEGLDTLNFEPDILLLNSSGSMFDDWEVPNNARLKIFELLSRFKNTMFIFETHANTVSEKKLKQCKEIFNNNKIEIELGLESANPWILKYCINKSLKPQDVANAITTIKKNNMNASVNILIGAPFLSIPEVIEDAVFSINWAFDQGADHCILFPVNVKPWTIIYYFEKHGIYIMPSLWTLIEIISKFDSTILSRINIAWYKHCPQFHPHYSIPNREPTSCQKCQDKIIQLLDIYLFSDEREKIINNLTSIQCSCQKEWSKKLKINSKSSLYERVAAGYRIIGSRVFGSEWWNNYGETILADLAVQRNY